MGVSEPGSTRGLEYGMRLPRDVRRQDEQYHSAYRNCGAHGNNEYDIATRGAIAMVGCGREEAHQSEEQNS